MAKKAKTAEVSLAFVDENEYQQPDWNPEFETPPPPVIPPYVEPELPGPPVDPGSALIRDTEPEVEAELEPEAEPEVEQEE